MRRDADLVVCWHQISVGRHSRSRRDAQGFVQTGTVWAQSPHWTLRRAPFLLETSRPDVCAGDVRSGSVKRVASAVGEGAMALVHEYFREM